MDRRYLLGVDVGTQGAKAVLCDREGRVLASAYREHPIDCPHPGWAEHDAEAVWWGALVALAREVLASAGADASAIAGIGVSAFVPEMLPLGADGRPLRPAILYLDRRASRQVSEIQGRLREAGLSEAETGSVALASPIPQLLWMRDHEPDAFRRVSKIAQCAPYLVYRLTGAHIIDHAMKRSYAPLYDPQQEGWSRERSALLGLEPAILPDRIAWATEIAGVVTDQAARASGLAVGTPVAVGTADAFADLVAAGAVRPGAAAALYGSFTAILIARDQPVAGWHGHHCLPGLYFDGAAVPTGAALTRWFRDHFGTLDGVSDPARSYPLLERAAEAVPPGSRGLIALPDFSGAPGRVRPALARGAFLGLTPEHSRAHLYRALLEGVAFELRYQLEASGLRPGSITAVGGGTRNQLWLQIVSDVLDLAQDVLGAPAGMYSAAFGDAYMAGMAIGWFAGTAELLEKWVKPERRVSPDPIRRDDYERWYGAYRVARLAVA